MSNSYQVPALGPDSKISFSLISIASKPRGCLGQAWQLTFLASLLFHISATPSYSFSPLSLFHPFILCGFIYFFPFSFCCFSPLFLPAFSLSLSCSDSVLLVVFLIHSLPFQGAPLPWKHWLEKSSSCMGCWRCVSSSVVLGHVEPAPFWDAAHDTLWGPSQAMALHSGRKAQKYLPSMSCDLWECLCLKGQCFQHPCETFRQYELSHILLENI